MSLRASKYDKMRQARQILIMLIINNFKLKLWNIFQLLNIVKIKKRIKERNYKYNIYNYNRDYKERRYKVIKNNYIISYNKENNKEVKIRFRIELW